MSETITQPPQLPQIANHYFHAAKLEGYTNALSDLLCWMDGFQAAGGKYSPSTLEVLRDLNCAIKSVQQHQSCGDSFSHSKNKTPKTK